jgi:hypothetical protein
MQPFAKKLAENPLRTRADVAQLMCDLVAPVLPHFSPGRAQVLLGQHRALYGDPVGLLEGFARPLWGLAPHAAGGGEFAHWDYWREGLAHGTDPAHSEYWGPAGNVDQRNVEMAAIAAALLLAPRQSWEPLSARTKEQVAAWLHRINEVELVQNNWLFFRVLVNTALRQLGQRWSDARLDDDARRLDGFDLGRGWYRDGPAGPPHRNGRLGDYYVPMAFHFYGLIFAQLGGDAAPEWVAQLRERARIFAQDFIHYFAADGAAIPFGRSLTYRFAQGAFWGALAFAGEEALPWPTIKGLYLRHLRWWMRQPIFSETGLLSIGYGYSNVVMSESYNSSASPYWGLKAFLPLALPAEHPFWNAEEAPLPARAPVHTVAEANAIFVTAPAATEVTMLTPGQMVSDWPRHAPQKYSKFAYSTRFGFTVPTGTAIPAEGGFDSMLALSDDGRWFRGREECRDAWVRDGVAFSRWWPWGDVEVQTWLIADDAPGRHVRVHRICTPRRLVSLESSFAVGYVQSGDAISSFADGGAIVTARSGASWIADLPMPSAIEARHAAHVTLGPNSHLLFPLAAMAALRGEHQPGTFWLACVVGGDAAVGVQPAACFALTPIGHDVVQLARRGEPWHRLVAANQASTADA